jgi:hypothetical protein
MHFEHVRVKLPDEAFDGNEINIDWLKKASSKEQYEALFEWFTNQYEDPAESLPYETAEGGYIPIHGDLVSPFDELEEFSGVVPEDIIEKVSRELFYIAGDAWSPIPSIYDFYEPEQTPLSEFETRINRVMSLLENNDTFLIKASMFSLLITAFETYLWEVTKEHMDNPKLNLASNLIENMEEFKKKQSLSEIYKEGLDIKKRLIEILDSETVWHNINVINLVFKKGFLLSSLPDFSSIQRALKTRHDIVHRFGLGIDGYEIPLPKENLLELKTNLILFVQELDQKINDRLISV